MSGDEATFRDATTADWPSIWPIFQTVIEAGDTFMWRPRMHEDEGRLVWFPGTGTRQVTFVAELRGTIVGAALLKPNMPGLGDHIANGAWMVSPGVRARGIGRRFGEHVIERAREEGYRGMQFNAVVASNRNAVALWTSLGFEIIGTVPDAFRHAALGNTPVHIMYRAL
jgi:L-amino acid N-acyltransferase YncA